MKQGPGGGAGEGGRGREEWMVALISGVSGAYLGLATSAWQMAIESAQVQGGQVHYPIDTPFSLYHLKLWTLATQIPALFMYFGVSEYTANLALNMVMGALMCCSLALCCLALSRRPWISAFTPLLIYAGGAIDVGVTYPILFLKSVHTFGIVGGSYSLLVLSVLGLGRWRLGAFLLGMAIAVHPSVGIWCVAVVVLALLWERQILRERLEECRLPLLAGFCITGLSFAHHLYLARVLPNVPADIQASYLKTYVEIWDGHRNPSVMAGGMLGLELGVEMFLVCRLWLQRFQADLTAGGAFLMRAFAISGGLSLAFFAAMFFPAVLPQIVTVAMPWRNLNLTGLAFQAFCVGLMARYAERWALQVLLGALVILLAAHGLFIFRRPLEPILPFILPLLVGARLIRLEAPTWVGYLARGGAALAIAATMWSVATDVHLRRGIARPDLRDWTNDPFFAEVHRAPGIVLTASDIYHIQLRAQRPVLLNGLNLNQLPYVLESAPAMERVLREIYGVEMFGNAQSMTPWGLAHDAGRQLWESRTVDEWRKIGREYGITGIVTYQDWKLQLPLQAANRDYQYYQIPAGKREGAE